MQVIKAECITEEELKLFKRFDNHTHKKRIPKKKFVLEAIEDKLKK